LGRLWDPWKEEGMFSLRKTKIQWIPSEIRGAAMREGTALILGALEGRTTADG